MKWFLLAVALLLAAIAALQKAGEDRTTPMSQADSSADIPATGAIAALPNAADLLTPPPPLEEYAAVTERPLFLPDRVPPEPDNESEQEPEPEPVDDSFLQSVDLTGVLIRPDHRIAWVRLPKEPDPRRLREGDQVEGWTVAEIRADRVRLRLKEVDRELMLLDYNRAVPLIPPTGFRPLPSSIQPEAGARQKLPGRGAASVAPR